MRILRTWKLGIKSLLLHPMRSALTVLGIFIGVASVIWLLAIGEGISSEAQRQIEDLGAENIIVLSIQPPNQSSSGLRDVQQFGLTRAEAELIGSTIPTVKQVVLIRELPQEFTNTGNSNVKPIAGRLVGCTPEYADINRLVIDRGHFITPHEIDSRQSSCVIAARLADLLFPTEDPMHKQVYLPEKREYFKIVGVLQHRNASAAIGGSLAAQDFSFDIYIPLTTMQGRIGDREVRRTGGSISVKDFELSQITVQIDKVENVRATAKLIESTLKSQQADRQDIAVVAPYELLEQAKTTRLMFMIFMGLIAAISLLVGGIGIMNIMLATVTERTREIGIRRALGAKRSDITRQFLIETISLSVIGGMTGVIGGLLCPLTIYGFRELAKSATPTLYAQLPEIAKIMTPEIVPASIPIAFSISVIVGVLFGIYPAMRAAQMDPIEALRHQ